MVVCSAEMFDNETHGVPTTAMLVMTGLPLGKVLSQYTPQHNYRGVNSLARPGRKQATATEDLEFHISYL